MYILCAEGLTGIIRQHEESGLLHGCKVARGAPNVSHLLFAEDCYMFFRATQVEATTKRSILHRYERLSGQLVNYIKSDIVFSPNIGRDDKASVCDVWG